MKKSITLRALALLLLLVLSFTACTADAPPEVVGGECTHGNIDGDNLCDFCGAELTSPENPGNPETPDNPNIPDTPVTPGVPADPAINYTPLVTIPAFAGEHYTALNGGVPYFTAADLTTVGYEYYGELDSLGRCTIAVACIGPETLPTTERGSVSSVTPTGWIQVSYDTEIVHNGWIWNRSHLIAWSLTGEDANEKNIITGTPYFNQLGMREFEDMVLDYVKETGNHVMYRVVPVFEGNNLVATGITMEGFSVEDNGLEVCFNVFMHNVNPGIVIDYSNGMTRLEGSNPDEYDEYLEENPDGIEYVLNTSSKKIHLPGCRWVKDMNASNKATTTDPINTLMAQGYTTCGTCKPQNNPNAKALAANTAYIITPAYCDEDKRRAA